MERLLERFEGELRNPQQEGLGALARTFQEIRAQLLAHFRKEEEVFYPTLEPALGAGDTEVGALTDDHADVREAVTMFGVLLDQARADPASPPVPSLRAEISSIGWQVWNLIHHHIEEEESGLFAFADHTLDAAAQERLAGEMRAKTP